MRARELPVSSASRHSCGVADVLLAASTTHAEVYGERFDVRRLVTFLFPSIQDRPTFRRRNIVHPNRYPSLLRTTQ